MKKFLLLLYTLFVIFPSHISAQQSSGRIVDGVIFPGTRVSRNYVKNPSALKNAAFVTTSSATITRDADAADSIDGVSSFLCTSSTNGGYCQFDSETILEGDKSGYCMAYAVYKGDASLYQLQVHDGSNVVTSSVLLTNAADWTEISVTGTCGSTRRIRLTQTQGGTAGGVNIGRVFWGKRQQERLPDTNTFFEDDIDPSKKMQLQLSGISTGTSITLTPPNATDTLVGLATAGTLTNKTISGASNTISNISLTTGVTGTLPIANGGTNATATPTAGGIAYGTGTAYAFNSAGTAGQAIVSGGTGAPTYFNPAVGGIVYGHTGGVLNNSAVGTSGQALVSGGAGIPTWFAPSQGAVLYAGASGVLAATAVGTTGRGLVSGGTGAPTFFNPGAGTIIYGGSNGELTASSVGTTGQGLVSGGTGAPTFFNPGAGTIIYGGSNGELTASSAGGSGQLLTSGGTGAPTWTTYASSTFSGDSVTGTNVDDTTATIIQAYYVRLGDIVMFAIVVPIDPTTGATATTLDFTPPVASNFTLGSDASGSIGTDAGNPYNVTKGAVIADATNDRLRLSFVPSGSSSETFYIHGMYRVK